MRQAPAATVLESKGNFGDNFQFGLTPSLKVGLESM
jgi:hypothetical protein